MNQVRSHDLNPTQALFVMGHVAWTPGGLDQELSLGGWHPAAVAPDLSLRHDAEAPMTHEDKTSMIHGVTSFDACTGPKFADLARIDIQTHVEICDECPKGNQ